MIVDEILATSAFLRAIFQKAHVIRVPFPVCPYAWDSAGQFYLDWKEDRIPRHMIPFRSATDETLDTSFVRAPYPGIVIASEAAEKGAIFVQAERPADEKDETLRANMGQLLGRDKRLDQVVEFLTCFCVNRVSGAGTLSVVPTLMAILSDGTGGHGALESALGPAIARVMEGESLAKARPEIEPYLQGMVMFLELINGQRVSPESRVATIERMLQEDFLSGLWTQIRNVVTTVVTTFSLLNCVNIVEKPSETPPHLQQARIRRGQLPLVTYHVLHISRTRQGKEETVPLAQSLLSDKEPVAMHWRRGHYKTYTAERPLFGIRVGRYWWDPAVIGKARRLVVKDYQIDA